MWDGVREDERRVKRGSMVYHAMSARFWPERSVCLSVCSAKNDGTLDIVHDVGEETSMVSLAFSKSSR